MKMEEEKIILYSIYLNISLIIILIIIFIVLRKRSYLHKAQMVILENSKVRFIDNNKKLRDQCKKLNENDKVSKISKMNLQNALLYKPVNDGKRHIDVCTIKDCQQIVIMFDEKYTYSLEYFDQQPLCKKEPYIESREFQCTVFIDGTTFDPILTSNIYKNNKSIEIQDINCGKYTGRGVGTCVIDSLAGILKGLNISELNARLSPVDFHVKDKLYNFYIILNGFELVHELTKDSWGSVKKTIA